MQPNETLVSLRKGLTVISLKFFWSYGNKPATIKLPETHLYILG